MRLSLRTLIYPLLALLLSACGSKDYIDPPTPLKPLANAKASQIVWQQSSSADSEKHNTPLTPRIWQQRIYLGDLDGRIQIFELETGQLVSQYKTGLSLSASPGVGEGKILVGSSQGELRVLDAKDGSTLWQKQLSSEILTPAQINGNLIIVRTNNNRITALNADDGSELWHYQSSTPALSLRGNSTPLLHNDRVFAGFDNGELVALDSLSGKSHWKMNLAQPRGRSDLERMIDIDAALSFANRTLYVSSFQGQTAALDPFNNQVMWQSDQASHLNLGVDSNGVYLTTPKGHVRALERYSGNTLWQQSDLFARFVSAPVAYENKVAVADFEGYVHWLNNEDGSFYARVRLGKSAIRSLTVTEQGVLSLNDSGQLSLLRP